MSPGVKCVSFDGDADRIVYFYMSDKSNKMQLVDGDKIATLVRKSQEITFIDMPMVNRTKNVFFTLSIFTSRSRL